MPIHKLIKFLTLLIAFKCISQEPAHFIIGKDVFDGVELYSIIQDKNKNIWITSDYGIFHYDGIKFSKVQLPKESKRIALFGLSKDNNGNVYCFNQNGQIFIIQGKQLKLYFTIPKLYSGNISNITFDDQNHLFVKIASHTLLEISPSKQIIRNAKNASLLIPSKQNNTFIYGLTDSKNTDITNIFKRQNGKDSLIQSYRTKEAFSSMLLGGNEIYLLNRHLNRLSVLKDNKITPLDCSFLNENEFNILQLNGDLWFSSFKKGVYKLTPKEILNNTQPLKWFGDYFISGLTKDNEGNTWLLTFNKGIIFIPSLSTGVIKPPKNKEFKSISKVGKHLFIGNEAGEIYKYQKGIFTPYFKTAANDRLEHLKVFPEKNSIVTSLYLYHKNNQTAISYARDAILIKDSVLLGLSRGLKSYNLNTNKENTLYPERIYDIHLDKKTNTLWLTTSPGLRLYKNNQIIPVTDQGKEILGGSITKVKDNIWINSKDGIYIFEEGEIKERITIKNGLFKDVIQDLKYESPYVYISYKKNMQRFDLRDSTFQNFTLANGITKSVIGFEVIDETVYALNSDGLLQFNFNNAEQKIQNYKTQIREVLVNNIKTIKKGSILNADENNIEFSFFTPTFKHQKELKYQYQLLGYEKYSNISKKNQYFVKYPNLPAGKYTFRVDSSVGSKKNEPAFFSFEIKKHWYDTLWFRAGSILLSFAILYYIYRSRLKSFERNKNTERMQKQLAESSLTSLKAQMNPHFLFNAMNSIQLLIIEGQKDEAYEYLTQLSNLVRENLMMSEVAFVPFENEMKLIVKYLELEKLRFEDTFTYSIKREDISNDYVLIPSMIIQPFIENAIKHGLLHKIGQRILSIVFLEKEKWIECIITDNGIGRVASAKIKQERNYQSFSTNAIHQRFSILKEYYKIDIGFEYEDLFENNKPSGTKVIIKIPYTDDEF